MPPTLPDGRTTLAKHAKEGESAELRAGVAAGRDANDPAEFCKGMGGSWPIYA